MNSSNYSIFELLLIISGIAIFGFFIYAAIISLLEKEKKAASYFILLGILTPIPFLVTGLYSFDYHDEVSVILLSVIFLLLVVYFVPFKVIKKITDEFPKGQIDERNTMFSRNELKKDSENYKEYYSKNPDKLDVDRRMKSNPGLLAPSSGNYDHIMFSSADASFFTVEAFKSKVDGEISSNRINYNPDEITKYIVSWAKKLGALDVGITELKDYHKYSYRGRKGNYGNKVELNHKFAIAFTVEMDYESIKSAPYAPIVMESAQQYLAAGAIGVQIAQTIRQLGFAARAHIDGNYEVVCPLVAKDAGLGEIGRMGLLMTPNYGPRVRIAVVTTDIHLIAYNRKFSPSVIDFCTNCKKCAINCPANAISYDDRESIDGVVRWQINQESCFNFWTISGTDCGRCISVCPYSHPNNLLHNVIRFGIGNSAVFSRLALSLDDVIYGKKPLSKAPSGWMKVKKTILNP